MLTNLLRPWILGRLLSGSVAALLCAFGLWVAYRVLRYFRVSKSSEGQLSLERRAELVAAVVEMALLITLLNVALTVLSADRMTHSVRGAMCAYGVFDASPYGFWALGSSIVGALGCGLWMVLHKLDLSLKLPRLTRGKFAALFLLTPWLFFDLYLTLRWALDLDMAVQASCCSVGLDDALPGSSEMRGFGPRILGAQIAFGLGLLSIASLAITRHRPRIPLNLAFLLLAPLAALSTLAAILGYVAPHVYETPHHLCPFCLLHADAWGIGWPLFGALFLALLMSFGIGMVELFRKQAADDVALTNLQKKLATWGLLSWSLTLILCVLPVLRYVYISGGASLFGSY